jgi:hypothetical protein
MTAEEFILERFENDGIGSPPKHVLKSIQKAMKQYARGKVREQREIILEEYRLYTDILAIINAPEPEIE